MFDSHWCAVSMGGRISSFLSGASLLSGMVIVLLSLVGVFASTKSVDASGPGVDAFTFTCESCTQFGRVCIEGTMVSCGERHRIVIYSIEPRILREAVSLLRYADIIIGPETTYYWVYGMPGPEIIIESDGVNAVRLSQEDSPESIVVSALSIVQCVSRRSGNTGASLEISEFLERSQGRSQYAYAAAQEEAGANGVSLGDVFPSDVPDALMDGGEYSKHILSDGGTVWNVKKGVSRTRNVLVTIHPMPYIERKDCSDFFDPNTLGRWRLVPECHRAYWSFDAMYCELSRSPDVRTASAAFWEQIEVYLRENTMPSHVRRAMDYLRFTAAVLSGDTDRVWCSAQACVDGLCLDGSLDGPECFLELARIAARIEERYPRQADQWLPALVNQLVQRMSPEAVGGLDALLGTIESNKWFTYGMLLLHELRIKGVLDDKDAAAMEARLEATRIARTPEPVDPSESFASVRRYMAHLDDAPPRGGLDMDDLRDALEEGLGSVYTDDGPEASRIVVQDTLRLIRLIAGEGPFCGDKAALATSIGEFAARYHVTCKTEEPIATVLSTFLALSFYDISTRQDHDILLSQFHRCCAELQPEVNTILKNRELDSMVTPEDVNAVFVMYEQIFRRYVQNPLWPAFKFPFTRNEESRICAALKLSLIRLDTAMGPTSDKVRYGGPNAELRARTIRTVSLAIQQLLPQAAFIRSPPYPGVSCQYRGGQGFSVAIRESLYEEGNRVKERFNAMRYFHLGHVFQEIVERERESSKPSMATPRSDRSL